MKYQNRRKTTNVDPVMPDPLHIGVFLPKWLGDFVMATPALRALRKRYPDAKIAGIMRPYLDDVLTGTNWLDEQWHFDSRRKSREIGHRSLLRRIRRARFDMMLLLPNSPRSALLAWLGNAKERIGYARNWRGPLLTTKVHTPRKGGQPIVLPTVDYYLRLAEAAGCDVESRRLELGTTPEDERSADQVFRELGLRRDGRIVAFNCSGAYGAAKLWPIEYFGELGRRIADERDHDVLVMCGPGERETAREIVRLSGNRRVFSMADQPLGIGTAKACLRRSRLMVSTDSGPKHLAAAMGLSVVTVYGPFLPVWGRNPTVDATDVYLEDLDCIGCRKRVCPLGHHRCMRGLTVDMVFREIDAWMKREESGSRVRIEPAGASVFPSGPHRSRVPASPDGDPDPARLTSPQTRGE